MPLLQKPRAGFAIVLEPEDEKAALEELAHELADSWVDEIQEAFPDGATGLTVSLKPAERLARYLNLTPDENDMRLFLFPDYVENVRLAVMQPPASEYWFRLITELPKVAERNIRDFLGLLRDSDIEVGLPPELQ